MTHKAVVPMLAALLAILPAHALTVTTRDAVVDGKVIRLGDVAILSDAEPAMLSKLEQAVLGYAPPAGTSRTIPVDTLRMHVLSSGVSPRDVVLRGGNPSVTRRSQEIPGEAIEKVVAKALERLGADGTNFEPARPAPAVAMPPGAVTYDVQIPAKVQSSFYVTVEIRAGEEAQRIFVPMKAVRIREVVVTTRRIERGAILQASDLQMASRDALAEPGEAYTDLSRLIGLRVTRALGPDAILTAGSVEADRVISRGDRVRLVARFGALEVSTPAEAMDAGARGETIRVRNLESKKIITARVVAAGEVLVHE